MIRTEHFSNNWIVGSRLHKILFVNLMKRQKGEEKLKRRAKLAGNLSSKRYPQPFTPPSLLTEIQTTFVASLSMVNSNLDERGVFCAFGLCAVPQTFRH